MAVPINPITNASNIDLTQRVTELKETAEAQRKSAEKIKERFEELAEPTETQRPVNPASRVGLNIDIKV